MSILIGIPPVCVSALIVSFKKYAPAIIMIYRKGLLSVSSPQASDSASAIKIVDLHNLNNSSVDLHAKDTFSCTIELND